jgi:dTDP-4-amino-4,6-dideoxygalactose transaminase
MKSNLSDLLLRQRFCGPPGLELSNLLSFHRKDSINSWYDNTHIIYFHKARAAIRYICQLLDIKPDDTVLVPSYNCGVEVDPMLKYGARIVMFRVDITGQIDLEDIRKRIDEKTRIIYINQYFGFPQPIEAIRKICDERGIYLIEDCALSLLSKSAGNKNLGSTGDISIFNLYKTLPLADGGALMINNPVLIHDPPVMLASPRVMVFFGFIQLCKHFMLRNIPVFNTLYASVRNMVSKVKADIEKTHESGTSLPDMPASYYYDENLGLRRMSSLSGYMLDRYDYERIVQNRRRNFQKYMYELRNIEKIQFLYQDLPEGICPLYFPILIDNPGYVYKQLLKYSVFTFHWWSGYHRDLPWSDFPEACYLKDHLLVLPVHHQLSEKHIDYIIQKLLQVM